VTTEAFRSQMRFLAWAGYPTVGFDALLNQASTGRPLSSRSVILTFDDGFESCLENAVPHLERFGFSATFFVVAGLVGERSQWLRAELGLELPLADWGRRRRLSDRGFLFGAHILSHAHHTHLSPDAGRFELMESKRILEERLGRPVRHMAYPYGAYNPEVRSLAQEAGYRTACAVRGGLSGTEDDPYTLRRIVVTGRDSLLDFACRLRTAQPWGQYVRRKARAAWPFGSASQ
jgi:peptidoglycan/xylan/chitin deacetylase (PgdA/CDA1 family)